MKRVISICLSLALVFTMITVPTAAVHADTAADHAVELQLGKTVTNSVGDGEWGYESWFTLTPTETTAVQLEISNVEVDSEGYSMIRLTQVEVVGDGEYQAFDIGIDVGKKVILTTDDELEKGKTYYFLAEYSGENPDYKVKVAAKKYNLAPKKLTVGTTVSKTFSVKNKVIEQRYDFTAPASERYEFEVLNPYITKGNLGDTSIEVFTADGEPVCANWSYEGEKLITAPYDKMVKGRKYYVIVTCTSPESYTVKVAARKHTHGWMFSMCEKNIIYHFCPYCFRDKSGKVSVSLGTSSFTYNGETRKPKVTVKCTNGIKVPKSAYTVTNKGRKSVGKGTVTVKFKGKYSDLKTLKKTYKVNPKKTYITELKKGNDKFTVKWKKKTVQTTGYQIRYSTSSSMKNAKTKLVKSNKTTSKTISKLKSKKKYYVQVRTYKTVDGIKYYSKWSEKKAVTTK